NRRKDPETGEDQHVISTDLKMKKDFDIKMMRKMKSYKGMRHSFGLPVRGQRTRAHFRHGKSLGVAKKKVAPAAKK
ncbi:MAG: 30S ribosomal protein S13, partial [Candidatus Nanoarchaeia archaeon]|nr:30S ribosomal protein S13 [Candidatus Nanoarchaeia archaeon]